MNARFFRVNVRCRRGRDTRASPPPCTPPPREPTQRNLTLSWPHRVACPGKGSIAKSSGGFVLAGEGRAAWNIDAGMSEPAASDSILSRDTILRAFPELSDDLGRRRVTDEVRSLHRPGFASPMASLRAVLIHESPSAFRSRNVFVSENALSRA